MTCREFADFINDYLERTLPFEVRQTFERHLQRCENCRRYLANYNAAVTLGRHAFDDLERAAAETGVPEELIRAILESRRA